MKRIKRFILLALTVPVSACSLIGFGPDGAPDSLDPGTYDLTYGDETTGQTVINADGSYAATYQGTTTNGTYETVDGKLCFTPAINRPEPRCWMRARIAEDGHSLWMSNDDEVIKVALNN